MKQDPFQSGKFGALGTFEGAYYDDDATQIASDDLSAKLSPQHHSPVTSDRPGFEFWTSVIVWVVVGIPLIVLVGWLMSFL